MNGGRTGAFGRASDSTLSSRILKYSLIGDCRGDCLPLGAPLEFLNGTQSRMQLKRTKDACNQGLNLHMPHFRL
jgi:hypothetical protein